MHKLDSTLMEHFNFEPVKPFRFADVTPLKPPDATLLYGLELEIEDIYIDNNVPKGFSVVEDGSLRNHGLELVSKPMTYSHIATALTRFFDKFPCNGFHNYSDRTSIHVHTNCQDLTFGELYNILMLYQVFERVLFNWIGNNRDHNIFCVPWHQSVMHSNLIENIKIDPKHSFSNWEKYTALNLVPLSEQGTIEWRHMHGHNDIEKILCWLRFIGHIYRVARTYDHEKLRELLIGLNTTSEYQHILEFVFEDDASNLAHPMVNQLIEDGVINLKYSMFNRTKKEREKVELRVNAPQGAQAPRPQFWQTLDDLRIFRADAAMVNNMVNNNMFNPGPNVDVQVTSN